MSDTKSKNSELLDWYEMGPGPVGQDQPQDQFGQPPQSPDSNVQTVMVQPPEEKSSEEKQPEPEKKIEDLGEMYKAVVTAKMISGKLIEYSTKESDEDKGKLKSDIKELVKKLGDIANGL